MILKILLLIGLIKLLIASQQPLLCSGIYAGVVLLFGLVNSAPFGTLMLVVAISFALASIYFWLLNRFGDNLVLFWVIAVAGIAIGFV
jgi:hypothetical protein